MNVLTAVMAWQWSTLNSWQGVATDEDFACSFSAKSDGPGGNPGRLLPLALALARLAVRAAPGRDVLGCLKKADQLRELPDGDRFFPNGRNADTLGESKCAHGEGRTRTAGMATGVKARRVYQFRHVGAEVTPDGSHAWWHCVGKDSGGWRSGSHSRAATRCYLLAVDALQKFRGRG